MRNDLGIYDAVAERWWSDDVRWVRTLKNLVPGRLKWFDQHFEWRGTRVLDLGCAGGFMAEAMAARGAFVTGIDPASQAIDAARSHARAMGLQIDYAVGIGEELPFPAAVFDAVVCVDVLEHVADLDQVIAETARVLRPGGVFLFDTINRNALARLATITIAEDVLRLLPRGTHDPGKFIKPRELRRAMEAAGLVPGPMTGLGPRGITRRFDLTFGPLPLTAIMFMGIAAKPGASNAEIVTPIFKGTMMKLRPTRNDLPAETRAKMAVLLNARLADAVDLALMTKQAHWNLRGAQFVSVHEMLDGFRTELDGHVDLLAERVVQLGAIALGTTQAVTGSSKLPPYPIDIVSVDDHLDALAIRYGDLANAVRAAIEMASEAGDACTADIYTAFSRLLDKALWFLESHRVSEI